MKIPELPSEWAACSIEDLLYLYEHGSYQQRLVSLQELLQRCQRPSITKNQEDHIRREIKRIGPLR